MSPLEMFGPTFNTPLSDFPQGIAAIPYEDPRVGAYTVANYEDFQRQRTAAVAYQEEQRRQVMNSTDNTAPVHPSFFNHQPPEDSPFVARDVADEIHRILKIRNAGIVVNPAPTPTPTPAPKTIKLPGKRKLFLEGLT